MTKGQQETKTGYEPCAYSLPTGVGNKGHDPTRPMAPSFSFGSRYKSYINHSPGPIYRLKSTLTNKGIKQSPRYTMKSRWTPKKISFVTPAPNMYSLDDVCSPRYKRSPKYSIGTKPDSTSETDGPGPNSYMVPTTIGTNVPHAKGSRAAILLGRTNKFGYDHDYAQTPGPVTGGGSGYEAISKTSPSYSIQSRPPLPENKLLTPGPGAYNFSFFGKSSPRHSMGIRRGNNVLPVYTLADVTD